MPDSRVQCEVVTPKDQTPCEANAFRVLPDGGDEFLLDFIHCISDEQCEVAARVRVSRTVLSGICERLADSVVEPRVQLISVPLEG